MTDSPPSPRAEHGERAGVRCPGESVNSETVISEETASDSSTDPLTTDSLITSTLHPAAAPLAKAFLELRRGKLADTTSDEAEMDWNTRFGEAIDLLDELFKGKLGLYPGVTLPDTTRWFPMWFQADLDQPDDDTPVVAIVQYVGIKPMLACWNGEEWYGTDGTHLGEFVVWWTPFPSLPTPERRSPVRPVPPPDGCQSYLDVLPPSVYGDMGSAHLRGWLHFFEGWTYTRGDKRLNAILSQLLHLGTPTFLDLVRCAPEGLKRCKANVTDPDPLLSLVSPELYRDITALTDN